MHGQLALSAALHASMCMHVLHNSPDHGALQFSHLQACTLIFEPCLQSMGLMLQTSHRAPLQGAMQFWHLHSDWLKSGDEAVSVSVTVFEFSLMDTWVDFTAEGWTQSPAFHLQVVHKSPSQRSTGLPRTPSGPGGELYLPQSSHLQVARFKRPPLAHMSSVRLQM